MLNLIFKDIRSFWHLIIGQILMSIALMSFGLFVDKKGDMTLIALIMYPLIIPTVILIGDKSYFTLCNALPVSRRVYVLSKYIVGYLASFISVSVVMLYGYIISTYIITEGVMISQILNIKGFSFIIIPIILLNGVTMPIFFKYSTHKGSFVLILLFILLLLSIIVVIVYLEKNLAVPLFYSKEEIFPVLMYYLTNYIIHIGINAFISQLLLGAGGYFQRNRTAKAVLAA
jgi:ABC-2 family transporter